ncbi:MAG TPA: hypothetical protein VHR84_15840 [Terriglobales bacterium]|jgi:hypothetical protein|nr:hypothetical protein [Terriglobales bacterium]
MKRAAANFLVFRDSKELLNLRSEWNRIQELVRHADSSSESALEALLRAADVECGLADISDNAAYEAEKVTDRLAALHVQPGSRKVLADANAILRHQVPTVSEIAVSRPEGFSYYGLHPDSFAQCTYPSAKTFAIVGIRSVGVILSAITSAVLTARGQKAERITVRPIGDPYDRTVKLSDSESKWVISQTGAEAHFLVVDEGPGLSGSSFLSVGDALTGLGASPDRITFVGTRVADPTTLCARDAAVRWHRFGWQKAPDFFQCPPNAEFIGEGKWRSRLLPASTEWPASWLNMERTKFLCHDGREFLKFDGLGRYGRAVLQRNRLIHDNGFGVPLLDNCDGVSTYERIVGSPLSAADLNSDCLQQLAKYCAFRSCSFAAPTQSATLLAEMTRHNVREELGIELELSVNDLDSDQPVITDGKMQPWEWLRDGVGRFIKTDAGTHGDDHFYPGPTDIAWDLAGTIVEWNLDEKSAGIFLEQFRRNGGRTDAARLHSFLVAYCAFRVGYCRMAAAALQDPVEQIRFAKAANFYRNRLVEEVGFVTSPSRRKVDSQEGVQQLPR